MHFAENPTGGSALQMMFVAANRKRATEMAALARSLNPDAPSRGAGIGEVQLNTPLCPSPTPPLSRAA